MHTIRVSAPSTSKQPKQPVVPDIQYEFIHPDPRNALIQNPVRAVCKATELVHRMMSGRKHIQVMAANGALFVSSDSLDTLCQTKSTRESTTRTR